MNTPKTYRVVCPECRGERYHGRVLCWKCNGEGSFLVPELRKVPFHPGRLVINFIFWFAFVVVLAASIIAIFK